MRILHWHLGDSREVGVTENVASTFQVHVQNSNYKQFEERIRKPEKSDIKKLLFFMNIKEEAPQPTYFDLTYVAAFKEWFRETMRSVDQELSYLSK